MIPEIQRLDCRKTANVKYSITIGPETGNRELKTENQELKTKNEELPTRAEGDGPGTRNPELKTVNLEPRTKNYNLPPSGSGTPPRQPINSSTTLSHKVAQGANLSLLPFFGYLCHPKN
jgi:hypothetical protein